MFKGFILVALLAASAPCHAQDRSGDKPMASSTTQHVDPAKRAWFQQAVSHILDTADDRAGTR